MKSTRFIRAAGVISVLSVLLVLATGATGAWANDGEGGQGAGGGALFVSPSGEAGHADSSCQTAAYSTIGSAVTAAPPGSTVTVCEGTYHEQVVIAKPLSLESHDATIDEAGVIPSLVVPSPMGPLTIFAAVVIASSDVEVGDFTVQNALGEGILVAGVRGTITDVDINHNKVTSNDLGGGVPPVSKYFECAAFGQIPGDCGEGIHLLSVADSHVSDNWVSGNSGGILLTDELGPTHDNDIVGNTVTKNLFDCGITVPGHSGHALDAQGNPQPSVAGVYDNLIAYNRVTDNGTKGEGAGVLFANAGPGSASYDNIVFANYIAGNELSGVTFHAHTLGPNQFEDLNGNRVIGNWIGTNNTGGDPLDSPPPPAPPGVTDLLTTGVLVFSGGQSVSVEIEHNHIFDNAVGIWLSKPVTAHGVFENEFEDVTTPISAGH